MSSTRKSPREQLTVTHVIDMFRALNLPVTNNHQQIKAKVQELRSFYVRQKGSTDGQKRIEADQWFKTANRLQDDRPGLLEIVRSHFTHLADTALEGALNSNITELTLTLYDKLEQFALKECQCDPDLAKEFLKDYLIEKGFGRGESLIQPQLVNGIRVVSLLGQIEIKWKLPEEKCDEVVVKRFESIRAEGMFEKTGQKIYQGNQTKYIDREIKVGRRYRYEIYSVWGGVESKKGVEAETVAIEEIIDVQARWESNHIKLSWQKPTPDCEVYIFRAPRSITLTQHDTTEPTSQTPEVKLVFHGKETEWCDLEVGIDAQYYYLTVAYFGPGCYSNGKSTFISTVAPPTVTSARAEYIKGTVNINWDPVRNQNEIDYIVVRTSGVTPATTSEGGKEIATTKKTFCQDKDPENGQQYTYTIFTRRNGIYSRQGCPTKPVVIAADVQNITVDTGDGSVTLRWEQPPKASQVVIHRSLGQITQLGEGVLVSPTGPGLAHDIGLHNGRQYYYRLYCTYLLGEDQIFSPGIQRTAVPNPLPGKIIDFQVERENDQVICTWNLEEPGTATIIRSDHPSPYKVGSIMNIEELSKLGHEISVVDPNRVVDLTPTPVEPYYIAFVLFGSRARVGPCHQCIVMKDVKNLRLTSEANGVRLCWEWPEGCQAVVIMRRRDNWPAGLDDPLAIRFNYSRTQYERNDNSFLDKITGTGKVFYVVYALSSESLEKVYSPGYHGSVQLLVFGEMNYSLHLKRQYSFLGPYRLLLEWQFNTVPNYFSGFQLICNAHSVPSKPTEGVEVFRWIPENPESLPIEPQRAWITLDKSQLGSLNNCFYCCLFYLNSDEQERVMTVHPDLSQPFEIS
jgi:hypothetical protein